MVDQVIKPDEELPKKEEESAVEPPVKNTTNFKLDYPYSSELLEEFDYRTDTAFLPSAAYSTTEEFIKEIPKLKLTDTQAEKQWQAAVNAGLEFTVLNSGLESTANREDATYAQTVQSEVGPLGASAPPFKTSETTKFTGERARLRIRQALKLGVIFNIPLWHSGFWIKIKSPSEGDLLEMYRQIVSEKVILGRESYGLIFSNKTSYTSKYLLDFCIENKYETSLDIREGDDIRKHIKVADLPILFWGLACATYPNGFQYTRGCISDPEKCLHVVKEKLDPSKLLWTDTSSLTQYQIKHMTKRQRGSMDMDSVKRYQDEFIKGQPKKFSLNDEVSFTLRTPSAAEHIDAGYRWINEIEENYSSSLIKDPQDRNVYLERQAKATMMRQYSHFVESITVAGDVHDDKEVIDNTLTDFTADDKLRNFFTEKVAQFIDESVVSMVAIPTYTCPNCGGEQKPAKNKKTHPNLIPIDVIQTFFTLVISRIQRIEAR